MTVRVLVTRPAGTWPALTSRFEGTRIVLQLTPTTVQVAPLDRSAGDAAVDRLKIYDWLVLTSGRGVSAFWRELASRGVANVPSGLSIAAVGPATARSLVGVGARADLVADDASSDGLAASLAPKLTKASRVLVVRPEGVPSPVAAALGAAGASVDEAPLYRTSASEHAGELTDAAIAGAFAGVVFTAPSSVNLWLEAAGARRGALVDVLSERFAIGPTTALQLSSLDLPADVTATRPTEEAVGDAIARAFRL